MINSARIFAPKSAQKPKIFTHRRHKNDIGLERKPPGGLLNK